MILLYDTETTGLTKDGLPDDDPQQPHLVQLGAMLLEPNGLTTVASVDLIVRPDGWSIPEGAARVHGITTSLAEQYGLPLQVVMAVFTNMRARSTEVGAHNFKFDKRIVDVQLARIEARTGKRPAVDWPLKRTCTMEGSTALVGLPPTARMRAAGFVKHKPPNLTELHEFLFDETFDGAHGAMADCAALARCFRELRRKGTL